MFCAFLLSRLLLPQQPAICFQLSADSGEVMRSGRQRSDDRVVWMARNARLRRSLLQIGECSIQRIIRQIMPWCLQDVGCKPVVSVLGSKGIETVKGSRDRERDLSTSRFDYDNGSGLAIPMPECIKSSKTYGEHGLPLTVASRSSRNHARCHPS